MFLKGQLQILQGGVQGLVEIRRNKGLAPGADAGKIEQMRDELAHAPGAVHHVGHVALAVVVKLAGAALGQQIGKARDLAQGFLEVMGGHVGELFQVLVGVFQFLGLFVQIGLTLFESLGHTVKRPAKPRQFYNLAGGIKAHGKFSPADGLGCAGHDGDGPHEQP